jgi:CDP-glucose 4,6-dehydratase
MNNCFNDYYKGKKVLVTGHTGFKGSWLSLWLSELGANVVGYSAYLPSKPCNYEVIGLDKYVTNFEGDVRDYDGLKRVFDEVRPEVVFHLAAQPIVRHSYDEPKLTFDTNVGGTVNVLECIKQCDSVESSVIITSDKCYKNVEWLWGYREGDRLGGDDPYSASKGCAEIVIQSYCNSYFGDNRKLNVASTRAGNVIGGGDWAKDRIVPDSVKSWSEGREVVLRNPNATRPWQHVLEPLSGYLCLGSVLGGESRLGGESFNFGPRADVIQSVGVLINTFKKHWEQANFVIKPDDSMRKESQLLKLCCDKALAQLNWEAILSFNETIEFTASWYRKYFENTDSMIEFSRSQIEKYSSLAKESGIQWAMIKK